MYTKANSLKVVWSNTMPMLNRPQPCKPVTGDSLFVAYAKIKLSNVLYIFVLSMEFS